MTTTDFDALLAKATTADELFRLIEERHIQRFPELSEALDREFVAHQIIAEATDAECAAAAAVLVLGSGRGHEGDVHPQDAEAAEFDAARSYTVSNARQTIAFAAQILLDRAVRKAAEDTLVRMLEWRTRGDEALAEHLLYKLDDHEGYISLSVGGPPGFNARRYFLDRVRIVSNRRRWAATAKAKEAADPGRAAQRRAKDNLRKARRRVRLAQAGLANATEAYEKADPITRELRYAHPGHPLDAARDRLAEAERLYQKAEKALEGARA